MLEEPQSHAKPISLCSLTKLMSMEMAVSPSQNSLLLKVLNMPKFPAELQRTGTQKEKHKFRAKLRLQKTGTQKVKHKFLAKLRLQRTGTQKEKHKFPAKLRLQ